MALTSTIEYCEDRDILDILPSIAEYDLKRRLYNFTLLGATYQDEDTASSCYIAENVGVITNLFVDGQDLGKRSNVISSAVITSADTAEGVAHGETNITLESNHEQYLDPGWIIGITDNDERMLVTDTSVSSRIVVRRGFNGTTQTPGTIVSGADIYRYTNPSALGSWTYVSKDDMLILVWNSDPNSAIVEAGDDWTTIKERFRRKASRLIESYLDNRLSREVLKDREGNYPEIIVHATALQTVILLLKAHDPNNEVIEPFKSELDEIIEGLRGGTIVLPTSISGDSSKGVIREVSVDSSTDLRPIELRGHYSGAGYELLKVIIDSADTTIIGTATFSVYAKNTTTLKTDQIIKSETINGDFQSLGVGNLYIRWGGDDSATARVSEDDEYEIELWGSSLDSTISAVGSVRMSRR